MCLTKTGLKAFLLVMNVLLFLCGTVVLGLGIWALMDKIFLDLVMGSNLLKSAAVLSVVCGAFLVVVAFIGCGGAISMNKIPVIIYTVSVTTIFILLMTAAIMASILQDNLETKMKDGMRNTLIENYGYMVEYKPENKDITKAWDILQTRLECCAIEDQNWLIYQSSRWFINQFREQEQIFVPPSCCVYLGNLQEYQNLEECQFGRYGAPRTNDAVPRNEHLHYDGCFDAAKQLVMDQSTMFLVAGFSFCVFLISSIVISIMFLSKLAQRGGRANLRR